MLSFRSKIFICSLLTLIISLIALTPLIGDSAQLILKSLIKKESQNIVYYLQNCKNQQEMVKILNNPLGPKFSQTKLLNDKGNTIYQSLNLQQHDSNHIDISTPFKFQEKNYTLINILPSEYQEQLTFDMREAFISLGLLLIAVFSIMTWLLSIYYNRPIKKILKAVKEDEKSSSTNPIKWDQLTKQKDEFGIMAKTIYNLSSRIQESHSTIHKERYLNKTILESLIEGVIAIDSNMKITYANSCAAEMLKINLENLVGHSAANTLPIEYYKTLTTALKQNEVFVDSITIHCNNERTFLEVLAVPTKNNQGALIILQDQSIRFKAIEMRKDFIANASHELKTPITIIHGFAEALHDNPNISFDRREMMTSKIIRNCHRMNNLINSLLTLTDIEKKPLINLEKLDIKRLLHSCRQRLEESAKGAVININVPAKDILNIKGDKDLLEMAICNIMNNAVKYSAEPAQISINAERIGNNIIVEIKDYGIGIPDNELENIFIRFYRIDKARSRKYGGSGLGLSIAEDIIHKHQGNISVKSIQGKGTTFTIRLPPYTSYIN